jgi:hypothetical protein
MTTTAIRKKVHQYVDDIDTNLLEAVYNILKLYNDKDDNSMLSKQQKVMLSKSLDEHKNGKLKYYTVQQAKDIIYKA